MRYKDNMWSNRKDRDVNRGGGRGRPTKWDSGPTGPSNNSNQGRSGRDVPADHGHPRHAYQAIGVSYLSLNMKVSHRVISGSRTVIPF